MPTRSIKTTLAAVGVTLSSLGLDRVASIDTETKRALRSTATDDTVAAMQLADHLRRIADSIDAAIRAAGGGIPPAEAAAPPPAEPWRVLTPIEKKDGTTYHLRVGTGYDAKDGAIGIYLDALPFGHRLILRRGDS